ncbi:restriction endonuclease subunit S [Tenacibaculum maritimum]|uniref:restriction endonuclease subunit S n=1 Tax=Tenacibaculum maritimum TaxID=107401 RepID=UPI0012E54BF5|nr:restriction endonuclease subunit S [Tenacibaculum maritimum]CAA0148289.1 conserved hypothetical protein [Tenacibaculum maritimum]
MELTTKQGFKKTEVGLIPKDWKVILVDDITTRIGDGIHSTPVYNSSGHYHFINGNNLKNGRIIIDGDTKKVNEEEFKKHQRKLNDQTILLSINGTIGNVAFYKNEKIVLGKSSAYINVNKKYCKEFLFHKIQTKGVQLFFQNNLTGSTIKNLGLGTIRETPISIPPTLKEQKAIATALSDMDDLIASLESLIAKKQAIKQGAMQQLLIPPHKGGKRLPGFSGEWEKIKIEKVISVARGGSPRPIQDYISTNFNGVNWIKIGDTSSKSKYITSSVEKIIQEGEQYSRKVKSGDFLLSNSMSFGRPYILKIDGCIHDGWLVLQNYHDSFDTEFLYYTLMSENVHNQYLQKASGSGVLNLNKEIVKTVELLRPLDIEEQKAIAKILSDMDTELEQLETKKAKYQQLKQGMLQELLTGNTRLV